MVTRRQGAVKCQPEFAWVHACTWELNLPRCLNGWVAVVFVSRRYTYYSLTCAALFLECLFQRFCPQTWELESYNWGDVDSQYGDIQCEDVDLQRNTKGCSSVWRAFREFIVVYYARPSMITHKEKIIILLQGPLRYRETYAEESEGRSLRPRYKLSVFCSQ